MPDTKITALAAITTVAPANDLFAIVDVSDNSMAASGTTKNITTNQILGAGGTATLASATITGDLTVRTNKLAVTSAGVGFGTTSPAYPAHFRTTSPVIAIQDDTSAATGVGGTMNFLGFTSGTSGANIFAQIKGVKTAGSAGGEYQVFTSDSAGNSVQRYLIDATGISTWSVAGTTAMTLNSTGLGVGVVPSAWFASAFGPVLQFKSAGSSGGGALTGSGADNFRMFANTYYDSSSQYKHIVAGFATQYEQAAGKHAWYTSTNSGALNGVITFTQAMTLDASGNLLVGKSTAVATAVGIQFQPAGNSYHTLAASTNSDTTLLVYSTGAAAYRFYVGMGGTVFATNTTISAISDARLKENVQDIDVGLSAILSLKPRKFDWKAGKGKDIKGDRGFIAQEFETVFPNLIDEWKDQAPEGEAPYKSVRQDLIPVLVKAIQELTARVQTLEAR
jgi:hypothetical protein